MQVVYTETFFHASCKVVDNIGINVKDIRIVQQNILHDGIISNTKLLIYIDALS